MFFLIGFAALWVIWLTLPQRSRRRLRYPIVVGIAIALCLSPVGIAIGSWGLTVGLPPDSGETADAIVVLGRGYELRDRRTVEAWELWNEDRAPVIFVSGMLDARVIVQTLQEMGIPQSTLSGEECSQSTTENGQFTSAFLYPKGVRKILLVTDSPHSLRSLFVFRRYGFTVISHPVELSKELPFLQQAAILAREYAGLILYTINGQLQPIAPHELNSPPTSITGKIQDWKCAVGDI